MSPILPLQRGTCIPLHVSLALADSSGRPLSAAAHSPDSHRSYSVTAVELVLTLYAGLLQKYPADVAKSVCMALTLRREKPNWFPTLSELDEACEKATEKRAALLASARAGRPSLGQAA